MTAPPPLARSTFATKAEARAYTRGAAANRAGKSRRANPYHCTTSQAAVTWRAWTEGYDYETKLRIWREDA